MKNDERRIDNSEYLPSAQPALLAGADADKQTRWRRRSKSPAPTFRDDPRQMFLPLGDEFAPPDRVG
jgi:hypothetical protein